MYKLRFLDATPVRMASAFNMADVELSGDFVPSFEGAIFQDKGIVNAAGDLCFLIDWNPEQNAPGFNVWKISEKERKVFISDRLDGVCIDIRMTPDNDAVELTIWQAVTEISFDRRIE